jgi:hypothetical protein
MEKQFENIKTVVVLVEFEDGSVHQVLASAENKSLALNMLARLQGKLMLSKEMEPIEFKDKANEN